MIIWNSKSILDGIKNYGTAFARKMGMAGAEGAFTRINKFGHLGGVGEINSGAFEAAGFANKRNREN